MSPQLARRKSTIAVLLCALTLPCSASRAADISSVSKQPDAWFTSDEGRKVLDNVLTWQNGNGGWWKQYDVAKPRKGGAPERIDPRFPPQDQNLSGQVSTFDNRATWSELRLLARAVTLTKDPKYKEAFDRGVKFVIAAQYPNGGWPQRFPLEDNYGRHITFNDEAMVEVMKLTRDIAGGKNEFAFVDDQTRKACAAAFDKGVECILNCQIKVDGKPTVWCAQHDEVTLAPAKARSYELPSFSGGESAAITMLLMDIENPSDRVKQAIQGAVQWYEKSKLTGIRLENKPDKNSPRGYDVVVVEDQSAPPLWGRFYDLETGKPYFCGRDGVKKSSMAEIELERRAGYAWLRPWGDRVLKAYPKWAEKRGLPATTSST